MSFEILKSPYLLLSNFFESQFEWIFLFSSHMLSPTFSSYIVATTYQNSTCSLLTSAKLLTSYLVVVITRELDKKPLLYCYPIYISYMWSMLQQCPTSIPALNASYLLCSNYARLYILL